MILKARDKPIISMLEWIRVRLMIRLYTKKIGIEKFRGKVSKHTGQVGEVKIRV